MLTAEEAGLVEAPPVTLDLLCVVHRLLAGRTAGASPPVRHLPRTKKIQKKSQTADILLYFFFSTVFDLIFYSFFDLTYLDLFQKSLQSDFFFMTLFQQTYFDPFYSSSFFNFLCCDIFFYF